MQVDIFLEVSLARWINFKYFFKFIYLCLRDRESEQGKGKERGRDRIPSKLRTVSTEPDAELELTNLEITT